MNPTKKKIMNPLMIVTAFELVCQCGHTHFLRTRKKKSGKYECDWCKEKIEWKVKSKARMLTTTTESSLPSEKTQGFQL